MALNPHFDLYNKNSNEQKLVEDLFAESIQIYGQNVYYIIRNIENEDFLFKEDVLSSFDESYEIEMYLENFDAFEGSDLISKFGFQIADQMTFVVSKNRFIEETSSKMPLEGNLLYLPLANALFEIKFVEDEQQFYPVGTLPAFKLQCEMFRYSNQDMDTGIPEVDQISIERDLSDGGIDPFADNDEIEIESEKITTQDENNPWGSY